MATPLTRETAQLLTDTLERIRSIDQKDRRIQPRFKKVVDGIQSGIDDASEDEIALYRPQLKQLGAEIDDALNTLQAVLRMLAQLRADKDLMASRFEQIEKLVKSVAAIRKRLADQAMQGRRLEQDVDKALAAIRKSDVAAEADLGALQSQMSALMKTSAYRDVEARRLEKAARAAWDSKDQKALTDARGTLVDWLQLGSDDVAAMKPRLEAYRKAHSDLDRERKAELQWMFDDLQRAADSVKRVERMVKELMGLGQVPKEDKAQPKLGNAEVEKIVGTFGLDTRHTDLRAKAMKILNACPVARWPRELARLYGAKEVDLKARLGILVRLPFVKPLTLIDV